VVNGETSASTIEEISAKTADHKTQEAATV